MKHLLTLICIFCTIGTYAQSKETLVKELIKIMKQDSLIDKTFNSIMPMMQQQIQSQTGGKQTEEAKELFKFTMQSASVMAKKMIDEDMVTIYSNLFTEAEIQDFITFYKSSSGQKMLTAMPEMQKQLMSVMMTKHLPELQEKVKKKAAELKLNTTPH